LEKTFKFNSALCNVEMLTNKKLSIYRHLILWLFLALAFYVSMDENPYYAEPYTSYLKIYTALLMMLFSYINMYWLTPNLLLKNKLAEYFFAVATLMVLLVIFIRFAVEMMSIYENDTLKTMFKPKPIISITIGLIFIAASTGIKLFQRWIEDTKRIGELTSAGMRSELEQLKNQINPHFLFNMLNNANVLTQKDPAKASQVLITLSDLLRYQLYDSARDQVLLTADIHFLSDFLNLEKVRRDHFDFMVSKEGNISGIQIPPFLFITFVENAIKHSLDNDKTSFVNLFFEVSHERLNFVCINSKPSHALQKNIVGGLGLTNVKRRLDLLFDNRHSLNIEDTDDLYTVKLSINL